MLSPSRQTTAPSRHRTANMSTTTRRYLYSCPAPRPSTPVRTHSHFRRGVPSQGPCPDGSKTRSPSCRSKTWRCAFRPREVSGGRECRLSTNQLGIKWKKYVQMSWFIFQFGTRKGCFCIMCHVYAATRSRRNMQISNIGFWESWRRSQSNSRRKVWAQIRGALTNLLPWQRTLHSIKGIILTVLSHLNWMLHLYVWSNPEFCLAGRFGIGVKAYFVFLRYLIYLNLLHCALICGFILVPTMIYGNNYGEPFRTADELSTG